LDSILSNLHMRMGRRGVPTKWESYCYSPSKGASSTTNFWLTLFAKTIWERHR